MSHYTEKEIIDFVLRQHFPVDEVIVVEMERHFTDCAECQATLARLKARSEEMTNISNPAIHLERLKAATFSKKRRLYSSRPVILRVAAVLAFLMISYASLSYLVQRQFDHSRFGLSEFEADYEFACTESHFRGPDAEDAADLRLFKNGVKTLFGAKRTTMGLFPHYDLIEIRAAKEILLRTLDATKNPEIHRKTLKLLTQIEQIELN